MNRFWQDLERTIPAKDGDLVAVCEQDDGTVVMRQPNPDRRPMLRGFKTDEATGVCVLPALIEVATAVLSLCLCERPHVSGQVRDYWRTPDGQLFTECLTCHSRYTLPPHIAASIPMLGGPIDVNYVDLDGKSNPLPDEPITVGPMSGREIASHGHRPDQS